MLSNSIFYHKILKSTIVAFGALFSDIYVKREADGADAQTIAVPIAYAPKEKWLVRLEQDPNLNNYTYTTLPRMSFEITGVNYDPSRKVGKTGFITCASMSEDNPTMAKTFAPTPYNIDISLYIVSKTSEDGFQIIEQIIPFFGPEFTLSIKGLPGLNIILDVPIILNSTSVNDEYDNDFETRRWVTWTLNFTLKTNFFGPVTNQSVIKTAIVDLVDFETYTVIGDLDTKTIVSEEWVLD